MQAEAGDRRVLAERISARVSQAGARVDAEVAEALARYLALLFRWNGRMNLTGLTDDDAGLDRLVVEPVVAASRLAVGQLRVIDIGSGGGSPAVPMRLARVDVRLRMVESKSRKAAFLREAVRALALAGSEVIRSRYEEWAGEVGEEDRADVVTVRGVRLDGSGFTALARMLNGGGRVFLFEGERAETVEVPEFLIEGSFPLVEALRSRLTVLVKRI